MTAPLAAELGFSRPGFGLNVGLAIPAGGVTALVGPSGGGKSTLLRLLAGLERPDSGRIQHGERVWFDQARRIDLAPRRRGVGLLFQDYALFPHLSVAGNIAYGLRRGAGRDQVVAQWLERLQLQSFAARRPDTLSGGQRQRVALARALAPGPEVLLLDEPFSAIDIGLRQSLRPLFQELVGAGHPRPTLLVTHDLDDVRHLADWVGVLIAGELRQFGPCEQVFARPADVEVARLLGWQNLLRVGGWEGELARGAWGELAVGPEIARARPDVLAIRTEGVRLAQERGLAVEVLRAIEMGGYRVLPCRLPDGTRLRVHLAGAEVPPPPGSRARLRVPAACLVPLSDDQAGLRSRLPGSVG